MKDNQPVGAMNYKKKNKSHTRHNFLMKYQLLTQKVQRKPIMTNKGQLRWKEEICERIKFDSIRTLIISGTKRSWMNWKYAKQCMHCRRNTLPTCEDEWTCFSRGYNVTKWKNDLTIIQREKKSYKTPKLRWKKYV